MIVSKTKKLLKYVTKKEYKTPLYALLADKLLQSDEIEKSEQVCSKGQKYFPDDAYGKFVEAKINKNRGNTEKYLKNLQECIEFDTGFVQAYYELISAGQDILSSNELARYYQKLQKNNFADNEFLEEYSSLSKEQTDKTDEKHLKFRSLESSESKPETQTRLRINRKTRDDNEDASDRIDLKIPIPTMTFVEVLMKQELYDQALEVLDIIENKTEKQDLVSEKRAEIIKLKKQAEEDQEE